MRETIHIPVSPGVIIEGELSFPSEQGGGGGGGSTTTICLTSGRGVIQTFGSSSSSPASPTNNQQSKGIVVFVNGSDSIRDSPRYQFVARVLNDVGLTTLIVDLLTPQEEKLDQTVNHLRFDLPLLSHRLEVVLDWLSNHPKTLHLPVGICGASTGGGAALILAANERSQVKAVVSRAGRPDLAGSPLLERVVAPTLCLVGENDEVVLNQNRKALLKMTNLKTKEMKVIPGKFEEPANLEMVAREVRDWFLKYLECGAASSVSASPGVRNR